MDRIRRIGLLVWIAGVAGATFDARLIPWYAAVVAGCVGVELVLARSRHFVVGHLALASIASAHAAVCLSSYDAGLTLAAIAVALSAFVGFTIARAPRSVSVVSSVVAGSCVLLALAELVLPPGIGGADESHESWSADPFEPDPELGWTMRANATLEDRAYLDDGRLEWSATYHTDEHRGRAVPGRPSAGPAVLLFGCSYAFGHGLDDEHTIAAQLQRMRPEARVFDYAALAYGSAQSWLAMKRCPEPRASDVVYVFIDDHLRRDSGDRGWLRQFPDEPLFELDASSRLQRQETSQLQYIARRAAWSLWKRSALFRRLDALTARKPDDERDVRRAAAIVGAMRADVRAKWGGACRFTVVFVPEAAEHEMSARSRALARALERQGIRWLDGFAAGDWAVSGGEDRFDRATGHPRAPLAAQIAGWIARFLKEV